MTQINFIKCMYTNQMEFVLLIILSRIYLTNYMYVQLRYNMNFRKLHEIYLIITINNHINLIFNDLWI